MKTSTLLGIVAGAIVTALVSLQTWTLQEVVALKVKVAELAVTVSTQHHAQR